MKCLKCGFENPEVNSFCSNCGQNLKSNDLLQQNQVNVGLQSESVQPVVSSENNGINGNKSNKKIVTIVIIVLAALILLGIVGTVGKSVFKRISKDNEKNESNVTEQTTSNNDSNDKKANGSVYGFWISSDKKAVMSLKEGSAGFGFINSDGDIKTTSTVKVTNTQIILNDGTDSDDFLTYKFEGDNLVITINNKTYTFVPASEDEFNSAMNSIYLNSGWSTINEGSSSKDNSSTSSSSSNSTSSSNGDSFYCDDRILGTWYNAEESITVTFSKTSSGLYVSFLNSYSATATMNSTTIDVFNHHSYLYSFSGSNLVLTNKTNNITLTFVKK